MIDLIFREEVKTFSFIVRDPDLKGDFSRVDFEILHKAEENINIEELLYTSDGLRVGCWR